MLRKIAIALAAAVIAVGASTLDSSAMRGGFGPGVRNVGGMRAGGMRVGGMRRIGGMRVGGMRRIGGRGRFARFGRFGRFRVGAATWGTAVGGSCWAWTPSGRVWVCGGGPSFRSARFVRGRAFVARGGRVWRGRAFGRGVVMRGRRFR